MKKKNEKKIIALQRENEEMKSKLAEGGPSGGAILRGSPLRFLPALGLSRSRNPLIPRNLRVSPI